MKLRKIVLTGAFASLFVLAVGCGSSSDNAGGGGGADIKISAAALGSLPSKTMDTGLYMQGPRALAAITTIDGYMTLKKFFKRECYMPMGSGFDNHCPATVDVAADSSGNPPTYNYKYTAGTLLGTIYHAGMYAGKYEETCTGTAGTVAASSFAAAASGGSPTKYLLDFYSKYTCLKEKSTTGASLRSTGLSGEQYALTTRYHYNNQTDFFQVYSSFDADKNVKILAYNFAGVSTTRSRVILIFNAETHRFAVKMIAPGTPDNSIVAAGVGGIDVATGSDRAGYYWVSFLDDAGSPLAKCVNNVGGVLQADNTNCADIPGVAAMTASSVATYLGLSTAQTTALAPMLDKFANSNLLAKPADTPTSVDADRTDSETNFPATVTLQ